MDPNHEFPVQTFPNIPNSEREPLPSQQNVTNPTFEPPPQKERKISIVFIIIAVLIVLLIGAVAYVYFKKGGIFKIKSYTEETFLTNISQNVAEINSASYTVSASMNVSDRESDAKPFTTQISTTPELREKYQNDYNRMMSINNILSTLRYKKGNFYPLSLKEAISSDIYYSKNTKTTDPLTNKEYSYVAVDNGSNFNLKVTFETSDAIRAIKKSYGYVATTTMINGNEVTFTKASGGYYYTTNEPPKPYIVQLGEYARMLTPDISGSMAVSAASAESGNSWKFNFDANGDFGDLSYKVNIDALKKNSDFYFKVNNIPSLFMFGFSGLKGKWVKISSNTSTSTDSMGSYSSLSYLAREFPDTEKEYKKNREKFVKLLRKAVTVASEEKLVIFRDNPKSEKVDGQELTRYEVSIRKESILPFYKKMLEEIDKDPDMADYKLLIDQGTVDYLESQEFSEVFDYLDKNNKLTMWTDSSGFPVIIENKMRLVPPDTAVQLKDKQINLVIKLSLNDINKNINIDTPKDAEPIEKLIKQEQDNTYNTNGSTLIKSYLSTIRATAEIVFDDVGSYGKKSFTLGTCKKSPDTLFANESIYKYLNSATNNDLSKATCVSNTKTYAISIVLPDTPEYSWCIDSTGSSKQIKGSIKGDICK